jgi:hypothetical protein
LTTINCEFLNLGFTFFAHSLEVTMMMVKEEVRKVKKNTYKVPTIGSYQLLALNIRIFFCCQEAA